MVVISIPAHDKLVCHTELQTINFVLTLICKFCTKIGYLKGGQFISPKGHRFEGS